MLPHSVCFTGNLHSWHHRWPRTELWSTSARWHKLTCKPFCSYRKTAKCTPDQVYNYISWDIYNCRRTHVKYSPNCSTQVVGMGQVWECVKLHALLYVHIGCIILFIKGAFHWEGSEFLRLSLQITFTSCTKRLMNALQHKVIEWNIRNAYSHK